MNVNLTHNMNMNHMCAPPQLRAVLNESGGARSQVMAPVHSSGSPRSSFVNRTPVPTLPTPMQMPLPAYVAAALCYPHSSGVPSGPAPAPAIQATRTLTSSPLHQNPNLNANANANPYSVQQSAFQCIGQPPAQFQLAPHAVASSGIPMTAFSIGTTSNPSSSFYTETDCEV